MTAGTLAAAAAMRVNEAARFAYSAIKKFGPQPAGPHA